MKKETIIFILFLSTSIFFTSHAQRAEGVHPQKLNQILNDINHRQNYRDKYTYAQNIVTRYRLSTNQLIEICQKFPHQKDKYNLALAAYPNILDKENFFDIYDILGSYSLAIKLYHNTQANLTNNYNYDRYAKDLPSQRHGNRTYEDKMNCSVPSNQFNYILETIKEQTFDDKMESMAKRHIEKECFSKTQFRQILALFSRDDNILSVIKFSYNIVPFKNEMYEFRDLLDFTSSKKELDEFLIQNR